MKILRNPTTSEWPDHRYRFVYHKTIPCIWCHALFEITSEADIEPFTKKMCVVYCPFCNPKHRIVLYIGHYDTLSWHQ